MAVSTTLKDTRQLIDLRIRGQANIMGRNVVHDAVPSEDRMQAFLWRHLVPAEEFKATAYDPSHKPAPKRVLPPAPPIKPKPSTGKIKFTKRQVRRRLSVIKDFYEQWLLTDSFYNRLVAECQAAI